MKNTVACLALFLTTTAFGAADPAAGAARAESCVACHGAGGISHMADTPSLAGQPERYLQWQLVYFRSNTRKNPFMQAMAATLTDNDIGNLAAYFAVQPPPPSNPSDAGEQTMFDVGQKLT